MQSTFDNYEDWTGGGKASCYSTHKGLKLGEFTVYGGSCSNPIVHDADIYVALQQGTGSGLASYPWEERQVIEIRYAIQDMGVPQNPERFKLMIEWLCNQLQNGKKIHVGCIGGHGRTGMVLAAMTAYLGITKDAIQYVRENYCDHAVESKQQVDFLMTHYAVTQVKGYKEHATIDPKAWVKKSVVAKDDIAKLSAAAAAKSQQAPSKVSTMPSLRTIYPTTSPKNLWVLPKAGLTNA